MSQMPVGKYKSSSLKLTAPAEEVELLVKARHSDPFHLLGPHIVEQGKKKSLSIRAFLPAANEVRIRFDNGASVRAVRSHPDGFFEAVVPASREGKPYRLFVDRREHHDPY